MAEEKRVVEDGRDVAEARCQYCGRTFKSPRGRSIHERACKEKEQMDEEPQPGEGRIKASPMPVEASVSQEAAELSEELAVPPPEEEKGGLKVDFRMPDASLVSDSSDEIKHLISQMEKERKRWEDERKKFLEQTESLLMDEEPYATSKIPEPVVKKGPDMDEVLLAEMKLAAELDDLKDELQRKANMETMNDLVESRQDVMRQLDGLDQNVETLTNVLGEFSARTLDDLRTLGSKLDVKADEGELKLLREIISRLDGKLEDLIDEVGHQEALNISKIPPGILELVYQTTLDDIADALNASLGEKDAEDAIVSTLEEVRARTSGSEMFRYEYPRWRISDIARSIEKGLISAKQVQMTYDEILKRLREHIPHHQPKSFRAMIKVKSQEFAVEKSSELAREIVRMQTEVQTLRESITEVSRSLRKEMLQMESKLRKITGRMEEIETEEDGKVEITEGFIRPEIPQEAQQEEVNVPLEEIRDRILESIPHDGNTLTKMKKQLEFSEEELQSGLDSLLESGSVSRKKRGKGFVYFMNEEEGGVVEDG